ncbi:MAG TPA: PilZ domain-containing protein, partial [Spirochaetia bacterium]|nr:PilZ domain-containing protein [Spirochaetia bacterium]
MVGILTYNADPALARKYLMDMMLPCGFIQLKLGLAEGKKIILKTLEANEARGRRGFVRARCPDPKIASLNVRVGKKAHAGPILDISAAGMSFGLDTATDIKAETVLQDIQLRLKGTLCRVKGIYKGIAKGTRGTHLAMFAQPLEAETTLKIHRFIFQALQDEMDSFVRSHAS